MLESGESGILGVPVVNIGDRQNKRLRSENILDVGYDAKSSIYDAIVLQMKKVHFNHRICMVTEVQE